MAADYKTLKIETQEFHNGSAIFVYFLFSWSIGLE